MTDSMLAQGDVVVLAGETYRGVRQRVHALLLEILNEPIQAGILTTQFSNFYRSRPPGENFQLLLINDNSSLTLAIQIRHDDTQPHPPLTAGHRLIISGSISHDEGGWQTTVRIPLGAARSIDIVRCQQILNQRSAEELSHEVSATSTRLKATRLVLNKVQEELNIAADIQRSMLISERETNRLCSGLDVGALMVPSKEVGGDLYDCIPLGNERYCLCVGDVSGKGVPASLTMSTCLTLVRSYAETLESPSQMMQRINQRLSRNNEQCTFTTLVIGILDAITGDFTYCNAGHNPPLVIPQDGSVQILREVHGPAVGAMEGMSYQQSERQLPAGAVVIMYSDGASEMFAPSRERYGMKRMESFFRATSHEGMPRLVRQFMRDLRDFGADEPQHDDITVLATRLMPRPPEGAKRTTLHLDIPNRLDGLAMLKSDVDAFSERHHLSPRVRRKLQVVLDELVSNVVRHGCCHLPEDTIIALCLMKLGHRLVIQLRDPGQPFNPFEVEEPDLDLPVEERPIGGLGLHLVRQMVSSYRYRRLDNCNQLDLEMPI